MVSDKIKQFIINELEESSKDVDFGSFKTETIYSGTIGGQSTCFVFYKDSSQEEQFMSIIYKMCPSKIKEKDRMVFAHVSSYIVTIYGGIFGIPRKEMTNIIEEWLKTKDLSTLNYTLKLRYQRLQNKYLQEKKMRLSMIGAYGTSWNGFSYESDGEYTFDYESDGEYTFDYV